MCVIIIIRIAASLKQSRNQPQNHFSKQEWLKMHVDWVLPYCVLIHLKPRDLNPNHSPNPRKTKNVHTV